MRTIAAAALLALAANTHHHGDHVGGNPVVAGKVQVVLAHANVRRRVEAEQAKLEPAQRGGLPALLVGEQDPERPARLPQAPKAPPPELLRYRDFLAALQAHAKASPARSSKELAESFDAAAWPEWRSVPTFVTWETLFDAVTGRGPGRVPRQG